MKARSILFGIFGILPLLFGGRAADPADEDFLQCRIREVSEMLGVAIVTSEPVPDSWGAISYQTPADEADLLRYLDIVAREFSKYPQGYLRQSHAHTLVLVTDLAFCEQPRAAIPDPYRNQLYLSINGAFRIRSERYLAHVMHHELHHLTEYSMWRNMTFDWNEWISLNGDGFCYGSGGADAYADYLANGTDFYSPVNPHRGFINRYSLTGDEEDRAELMAFIMSDHDRPVITELLEKDDVLREKSRLLARLFADFGRPSVLGRLDGKD
ncbi:MAG TPA: hypothetical protein VKZ86_11255 [Cyclobacteriaceae bacterium]|nr:hypothetical protein [Cyclobacteriaceae bacterium]